MYVVVVEVAVGKERPGIEGVLLLDGGCGVRMSTRRCRGRTTFELARDMIRYEPVPDKLCGVQDRRRKLVLELEVLLVAVVVLLLVAMSGRCY